MPGVRRAEGIGDRVLLVPEVQPPRGLEPARAVSPGEQAASVVAPGEQVSVLAQRAAGRYERAHSCPRSGRIKTQDVKTADSALAMRIDDYACHIGPGQQPAQSFGDKSSDVFPQVVAAHVGNDVVFQGSDYA